MSTGPSSGGGWYAIHEAAELGYVRRFFSLAYPTKVIPTFLARLLLTLLPIDANILTLLSLRLKQPRIWDEERRSIGYVGPPVIQVYCAN